MLYSVRCGEEKISGSYLESIAVPTVKAGAICRLRVGPVKGLLSISGLHSL
jgi:hypothetical protein